MPDEMRDALEAAFEEHTEDSVELEDESGASPENSSPIDDSVDSDSESLAPEDSAPVEEVKPENLEPEAPADPESEIKPPQSWAPAAREEWAKVPAKVKETIQKREQEIEKTLNDTAQTRQFASSFQNMVQPYLPMFQAQGVDPATGINNTLQLAAQLQMGTPIQKAQAAANIIQQFGVDITTLDDLIVGDRPAAMNPHMEALQQQVQQLQGALQQQQMGQQQTLMQQQQQVNQETQQFLQSNEFANDLRFEMADLMELADRRGQPITLQVAYDRAIAGRPDIQQIVQNRQTQQSSQQALEQAQQASSSLPQAADTGAAPPTPADLRSAIEQAWDES